MIPVSESVFHVSNLNFLCYLLKIEPYLVKFCAFNHFVSVIMRYILGLCTHVPTELDSVSLCRTGSVQQEQE